MTQKHMPLVLLGLFLVFGLAACVPSAPVSGPTAVTPTAASPTPTSALATPYAQEPAAGICASFDGEVVTITLNTNVPDPRCAKIRPDQTLKVVNKTLSTLQVILGQFRFSVLPGAEHAIDVPFGSYLAVGVHRMEVTPYYGAELWLEANQ